MNVKYEKQKAKSLENCICSDSSHSCLCDLGLDAASVSSYVKWG